MRFCCRYSDHTVTGYDHSLKQKPRRELTDLDFLNLRLKRKRINQFKDPRSSSVESTDTNLADCLKINNTSRTAPEDRDDHLRSDAAPVQESTMEAERILDGLCSSTSASTENSPDSNNKGIPLPLDCSLHRTTGSSESARHLQHGPVDTQTNKQRRLTLSGMLLQSKSPTASPEDLHGFLSVTSPKIDQRIIKTKLGNQDWSFSHLCNKLFVLFRHAWMQNNTNTSTSESVNFVESSAPSVSSTIKLKMHIIISHCTLWSLFELPRSVSCALHSFYRGPIHVHTCVKFCSLLANLILRSFQPKVFPFLFKSFFRNCRSSLGTAGQMFFYLLHGTNIRNGPHIALQQYMYSHSSLWNTVALLQYSQSLKQSLSEVLSLWNTVPLSQQFSVSGTQLFLWNTAGLMQKSLLSRAQRCSQWADMLAMTDMFHPRVRTKVCMLIFLRLQASIQDFLAVCTYTIWKLTLEAQTPLFIWNSERGGTIEAFTEWG